MSILVVGGTGTLGRQIVKQGLNEGYKVKCLVRDFRRSGFLQNWGAELVYGDLSKPSTIPLALKNSEIIIDSATIRASSKYTSEIIDWQGKLALLAASKFIRIKKFIFFSIFKALKDPSIPLFYLKLMVENELEQSGLNYTIYQCAGFFQGLIGQYALPVLDTKLIWLPRVSVSTAYLDTQDAAEIVIQSLNNKGYDNKRVPLIGEKFWTPKEIIQLCERLSGKVAKISYIPEIIFIVLRQFFRFFEFSWNVADRLQAGEISNTSNLPTYLSDNVFWSVNRLKFESYLQEYFGKILKKLRENNYQQSQKSDEVLFL